MMFRYFNLSLFQQVLCYAYSLPLALFFTFAFSPVGTWSWSLLFILFVLLVTLGWTGLAFHLRRLDRLRRGSDATDVFLRQGKRVVGQIKRQTKAQLETGRYSLYGSRNTVFTGLRTAVGGNNVCLHA